MKKINFFLSFFGGILCLIFGTSFVNAQQNNPHKAPLYWSPYEYHIQKEMAGESSNYLPEDVLMENINWLENNLKSYGYNMVCMDGWGDVSQVNANGYRTTHSSQWQHDYAWWSNHLQSRGMTLGMYDNPLWLHVDANDTTRKIVGTNINVSSLLDSNEETLWFKWVQVDRPGAEEYVKGYVKHYADMGIKYLRVDFLSWFESGYDRNMGTVGPNRPKTHYQTALRWMREACDANGVYLSLVMPNLFNTAELEKQYGHLIRVNSDALEGGWNRFSDVNRGIHHESWSQYDSAFDGFIYWSQVTGTNKVQLDGDFIMLNTFDNDTEKRSVISLNVLAGGPVTISDQYNTIGNDLWLYQNEEILALNAAKFVGKPLSNDPLNVNSQTWRGQLSNGDWIIGFFNRESTPQVRSMNFLNQLGVVGDVMVRDLWQHANLGKMNEISVTLPPHGSMVIKLIRNSTETCNAQQISFPAIADVNANTTPFTPNATADSGLPVEYEIASGPAKIVNNQIELTGTNGTVYVIAKQDGGNGFCAAIPQVQSFKVSGGRASQMFAGGTFSGWTPKEMTLEGNSWKLKNVILMEGAHELKFLDTGNWSGNDWGNATGLSGTAQLTTGGGNNITFNIPISGNYTLSFNDLTLEYSIEFTPVHQSNMHTAGTFSGWALQPMTLQNDIWYYTAALTSGEHELKFANTNNWSGKDWGNAVGLEGTATETTGGGDNIRFTIEESGNYDMTFNDMTLQYKIFKQNLAVNEAAQQNVILYPNPVSTKVFADAKDDTIKSYSIYDISGKMMMSGKANCAKCEINVSTLPKGVYIIHLNTENKQVGQKLIIQ